MGRPCACPSRAGTRRGRSRAGSSGCPLPPPCRRSPRSPCRSRSPSPPLPPRLGSDRLAPAVRRTNLRPVPGYFVRAPADAGDPGAGIVRDTRGDPRSMSPEAAMPIATPEVYAQMLDRAKAEGFAYPAINITSSETVNAAIKGFADAGSDGIIQVSTGGAEFASGTGVKEMVTGATALAEFAHVVAAKYPVHIALHTDHCPKNKLDTYVRPLLAISRERVDAGRDPLFQSHMWDGSAVELEENLQIAQELLAACAKARIVMEMEIGVVGGEEDGVENAINEKLYTTPEDALRTAEILGTGENGRYMLAATFGNVHGVYKPGHVRLRPSVLKQIQAAVGARVGKEKPFALVFHGGSGSTLEEIRETLDYGVVKMN